MTLILPNHDPIDDVYLSSGGGELTNMPSFLFLKYPSSISGMFRSVSLTVTLLRMSNVFCKWACLIGL